MGKKSIQRLLDKEKIAFLERQVLKYKYDNLTGLKQRKDFEEDFFQRFHNREPFSLTIIDIDDLKQINDLSYFEGDKAIKNVGHSLSSMSGECYRIGGDEFAILSYKFSSIKVILTSLKGITYSNIYSDYSKCKSTKSMFSKADTNLKKLKKDKKNENCKK